MEMSADHNSNKSNEMTPKNIDDPVDTNANGGDTDLQEVAAVNQSLDELTRALDFFEQRTDDIIAQLRVLLDSNREIRQQIAQDKELDLNASLAVASISTTNKMPSGDAEENINNITE
ncbi:UPF0184 protein CG14818-like [Eurosta solidaginis]|uniref:UPF0184 protein CG14818-like n=1 Tax=Eurosta solidaginis TaxID=178769 RepID=UPI0035311F96